MLAPTGNDEENSTPTAVPEPVSNTRISTPAEDKENNPAPLEVNAEPEDSRSCENQDENVPERLLDHSLHNPPAGGGGVGGEVASRKLHSGSYGSLPQPLPRDRGSADAHEDEIEIKNEILCLATAIKKEDSVLIDCACPTTVAGEKCRCATKRNKSH